MLKYIDINNIMMRYVIYVLIIFCLNKADWN